MRNLWKHASHAACAQSRQIIKYRKLSQQRNFENLEKPNRLGLADIPGQSWLCGFRTISDDPPPHPEAGPGGVA